MEMIIKLDKAILEAKKENQVELNNIEIKTTITVGNELFGDEYEFLDAYQIIGFTFQVKEKDIPYELFAWDMVKIKYQYKLHTYLIQAIVDVVGHEHVNGKLAKVYVLRICPLTGPTRLSSYHDMLQQLGLRYQRLFD